MASVNKVILIGRLGQDPDLKHTPAGVPVATFSIATNEGYKDKNGEKHDRVEWHRIVVWGKQAENCKEYLAKGRPVYIEGRLQTRKWKDKEGSDRYVTEVVAATTLFLDSGSGRREEPPAPEENGGYSGSSDDDIPF